MGANERCGKCGRFIVAGTGLCAECCEIVKQDGGLEKITRGVYIMEEPPVAEEPGLFLTMLMVILVAIGLYLGVWLLLYLGGAR